MGVDGTGREDGGKPLVLLVDDDAELLELGEFVLDKSGLRVVTASNGRRALSVLEVISPDVIVTDLMMPELDGMAFIREYRRRPPPHAPVIAVSGFRPYLQKARELGAVAALSKPYSPRELAAIAFGLASGRSRPVEAAEPAPAADEDARLRALFELRLEEISDPDLQRFLDEVAAVFAVPVAGISAVTRRHQRLVLQCSPGPRDPGGSRDDSFCTHAVAARAALVVQDALDNPFFRDNPSVTERGFRFYAGVPLLATSGQAFGTLCILDFEAHPFTYIDLELLGLFGRRVLAAFEWRDRREHPDNPDSTYRNLNGLDPQLGIYGKELFADLVVLEASRGIHDGRPASLVAVAVRPERLADLAAALRAAVPGAFVGRLGRARLGVVVRGEAPAAAQALVERCAGGPVEVAVAGLDQYQGASGQALLQVEQALGEAGR